MLLDSGKCLHVTTVRSVHQIWNFMWSQLGVERRRKEMVVSRPQLRSINVFVGPQVPLYKPFDPENAGLYEKEELTFELRLCERDEEANSGLFRATCPELEALKAKFGAEPPVNHWQERLLQGMIDRVEHGIPLERGTNLYSAKDLTRPLNMPAIDFDDSI